MKKYTSVFEMLTRSTLYKVLLVLVVMVSAQMFMFYSKWVEYAESTKGYVGLEMLIDESYMILPLAVGFILITVILCRSGCNIGSNQGYTLRRLRISEKAVFGLQALYNSLCYILLWGSQLAVVLLAAYLYLKDAADITNQTLVLSFYKNAYMHSILPMENGIGWFVLVYIIVGCGLAAARFPWSQRRGSKTWDIVGMVGSVFVVFPNKGSDGLSFVIICFVLIAFVYAVMWGQKRVEKEE